MQLNLYLYPNTHEILNFFCILFYSAYISNTHTHIYSIPAASTVCDDDSIHTYIHISIYFPLNAFQCSTIAHYRCRRCRLSVVNRKSVVVVGHRCRLSLCQFTVVCCVRNIFIVCRKMVLCIFHRV